VDLDAAASTSGANQNPPVELCHSSRVGIGSVESGTALSYPPYTVVLPSEGHNRENEECVGEL